MSTQRLTLYRRHVAACTEGYPQNEKLIDGDKSKKDCSCPIACEGYLDHEEGRIRHRSLDTNEWQRARLKANQWLSWKQTTNPGSLNVRAEDVTVAEACDAFMRLNRHTAKQGKNTTGKYDVLFNRRLLPWCEAQDIRLVKDLDNAITVQMFFASWANLQPVRGHKIAEDAETKSLSSNTTRVELERLRSFLRFCVENGWLKANHAKTIRMGKVETTAKVAWTMDEWSKILDTLETLPDQYGRTGKDASEDVQAKNRRVHAFALLCRYTGQRVGDVAMLGPRSIVEQDGRQFIQLIQQKTGTLVKVPVPASLVAILEALPVLSEQEKAIEYKTNNRTLYYGPAFWFWTGNGTVENSSKDWSDDLARVLRVTQRRHGSFEHHATPHTFRHFFAISHLSNGADIKIVSRWLGHSSVTITEDHYGHANADLHEASYDAYMKSMEKQDAKLKGKQAARAKVVKIRKAG